MKTTPPHTTSSRIRGFGEEILGPVRAPRGTLQRRVLLARSAVAYGGVIITLIQVVVWLMIGVLTGHLDTPWWLWTAAPVAAAVAGLTLVDRWRTWWIAASTASASE